MNEMSDRDVVALLLQVGLLAHYGKETVTVTPFHCFDLAEQWLSNRDLFDLMKNQPATPIDG